MASESDEVLSEFIGVTGADEERARFFLQSANWELHTALETFYDNDSVDMLEESPRVIPVAEPEPHDSSSSSAISSFEEVNLPQSRTTSSGGRFATLAQYQNEESNSSDEEGQAFYAGGSVTSGQQILGPRKKKNTTQSLFDAAKSHGAEVVEDTEEPPNSSKTKHAFSGAGFKLGSDVEPSQQMSASISHQQDFGEPQNVVISFWKNGFTVDDGPLRDINDPRNKDFLNSIQKGEVPSELRRQSRNGEVHVNMEDHREDEYKKPKESTKAFSGRGHTLGNPSPVLVQEQPDVQQPPQAAIHVPSQPAFKVDESKPITTIQIRLSDGTRLVTKFNHDNTVRDIRDVVQNARPNTGSFNLMTTFPNKVLNDNSITIADAKLLNAVIVQRMI